VVPKSILKKPSQPKANVVPEREEPQVEQPKSDPKRKIASATSSTTAPAVPRRLHPDASDGEASGSLGKKRVEDRLAGAQARSPADDDGGYVYPKTPPVQNRKAWTRKSPPPPNMPAVSQAAVKNVNAAALKQRTEGVQATLKQRTEGVQASTNLR
jgi:hypothetical protein